MNHRTFSLTMARDYVILMVAVAVIVAAARFGAEWFAGFLVLVVIPASLIVIVVLDARASRRRDNSNSLGADHAHNSERPPACAAAAPTASGPADPLLRGRSARPNVTFPYTDRVTRPRR